MVRQKLKKGFIILKNSTLELLIPPLKRIGDYHSRILSVSLVPLIISMPIMVGQWWYNCSSRRPLLWMGDVYYFGNHFKNIHLDPCPNIKWILYMIL